MTISANYHSFTPELLAEVRQVDLLSYLMATAPQSLVKSSPNEYRTTEHGSLAISNGKWNWFAGQVGGYNALDYLIKVENEPFPSAVEKVSAVLGVPLASVQTFLRNNAHESTERREFQAPERAESTYRVERYLTSRGIDRNLIQQCIRDGSVYESRNHHNVVFTGKDEKGVIRFASLRGTYPQSTFRMDVVGSDKRNNFLYVPLGCDLKTASSIAVFESPIDALSFVTLNQRYQICPSTPWYDLPCLSCSGTAHTPVLHFLKQHPNVSNVLVCFDNDDAGKKGMLRVAQQIQGDSKLHQQVKTLRSGLPPPDRGKDWNEVLAKTLPPPKTQYQRRSPPNRSRTAQKVEVI